jgi:hypothetical protein
MPGSLAPVTTRPDFWADNQSWSGVVIQLLNISLVIYFFKKIHVLISKPLK